MDGFNKLNNGVWSGTAYTKAEFGQMMAELGLTPTPMPTLPVKVGLSDGRTVTIWERADAGGDEQSDLPMPRQIAFLVE